MTTATPTRPLPRPSTPTRARPGRDVGAGGILVAAVAAATCWLLGLPTSHVLVSGALYAVLAVLLRRHLPPEQPGPGVGAANRVTLTRAILVLPVAAAALSTQPLQERGLWWLVAVSTVALVLDSVDGWVARRTGTSSAFGARFDMEMDALLLLALSVLVWRSGRVGSWVLLIGALRYAFVIAGGAWPTLKGELPPSARRKTVCVVQGIALVVALAPVIPAWAAIAVTGSALATLVYSFAVDVWWLGSRPDVSLEVG